LLKKRKSPEREIDEERRGLARAGERGSRLTKLIADKNGAGGKQMRRGVCESMEFNGSPKKNRAYKRGTYPGWNMKSMNREAPRGGGGGRRWK